MMRNAWILCGAAIAAAAMIVGLAGESDAAALNESGSAEEIDACTASSYVASVGSGNQFLLSVSIREVGVTEGPGAGAGLLVQLGYGPSGSDPRSHAGWTYTTASYSADSGDGLEFDVYQATPNAPDVPVTTSRSLVARVSQDGGTDYTYCDSDGAGSTSGFDFGVGSLGSITVTGSGTDQSDGSITTTVEAQEAPGPCILLSNEVIDYGTLAFSTPLTSRSAPGEVTVTNCGVEPEDILARGADATGATATWILSDAPNGNTCDLNSGGVNEYAHTLTDGNPGVVTLMNTNQMYRSGLGAGIDLPTDTTFYMPCSGSDGAGELMSTSITFTALAIEPQ